MKEITPTTIPRWYGHFKIETAEKDTLSAHDTTTNQIEPKLTILGDTTGVEIRRFGQDSCNIVLFEGYLFDRDLLIQELAIKDEPLDNAQLAAKAYQRWGARLFEHLDGGYAIAIWDAEQKVFILGNDALCMHPLYYVHHQDNLWFASNILLLAHNGPKANEPNRLAAALFMMFSKPPKGETFFKDIVRVTQGQYLIIKEDGQLRKDIFWDPIPAPDDPWLPDEYVLEQYEPLLQRAVARSLALGAKGVMLSGGLDSVVIAAIASHQLREMGADPLVAIAGKTPPGFAPFGGEELQETVAERLGMRYAPSNNLDWLAGREMVSASLEILRDFPAPSFINWTSSYLGLYRQGPQNQAYALLTGSGGDDWFGAGEPYAADLIRKLQLIRLWHFMKSVQDTGGRNTALVIRLLLWNYGLRLPIMANFEHLAPDLHFKYRLSKLGNRYPHWLAPDPKLKEELIQYHLDSQPSWLTSDGQPVKSFYRSGMAQFFNNPYLLQDNERDFHAQNTAGIRLFSPYHDRLMVEFMFRVSPELMTFGNKYKGLLRPVAEKYLPGIGLLQQRKAYPALSQLFTSVALKNGVGEPWEALNCNACKLATLGIIDAQEVKKSIPPPSEGSKRDHSLIFAILSCENWLELHCE